MTQMQIHCSRIIYSDVFTGHVHLIQNSCSCCSKFNWVKWWCLVSELQVAMGPHQKIQRLFVTSCSYRMCVVHVYLLLNAVVQMCMYMYQPTSSLWKIVEVIRRSWWTSCQLVSSDSVGIPSLSESLQCFRK